MSHNPLTDRLIALVEPVCHDAGCELVDLRLLMEQGGWVLRVCVDLLPVEGEAPDLAAVHEDRVDLATCEELSRQLSAVLDVDDPIPQAYSLEVSSPGIDRPLRTAGHFTTYSGAEAKIQLAVPLMVTGPSGPGERRNFRGQLLGVVGEPGRELVAIEVDGKRFELPLADIESARLVPDWDAVMRGGSGVSFPAQRDQRDQKKSGKRGGKPASKKAEAASARTSSPSPTKNSAVQPKDGAPAPSQDIEGAPDRR